MNYFDQIDEIGEEKPFNCNFCGVPSNHFYCSPECKKHDNNN